MRRLTAPVILIILLAALPASAGKIGFVNAEVAVAQVEEGKQKFAELQAWQEPRQTELDRLRDRVLALREQIAEQQGSATPETLQALERDELEARRAFEDARRIYERELEEKKNQFLSEVASKIGEIGKEYGKANDYDAVFLLTAQPMIYVSEEADITGLVVDLYNQRYPVRGQ
jgi:Skp family chaperone for outer membrane proteins